MDESRRFLILSLSGEGYAIPLTRLLEITAPHGLRRDTDLTEAFEGKYEFRGKWIPVLNLKKVFKLQAGGGSALLVINSSKGVLGLLADSVTEILDTGQKQLPLPRGVINPSLRYYSGILRHGEGLVLLLNEDGLLP